MTCGGTQGQNSTGGESLMKGKQDCLCSRRSRSPREMAMDTERVTMIGGRMPEAVGMTGMEGDGKGAFAEDHGGRPCGHPGGGTKSGIDGAGNITHEIG